MRSALPARSAIARLCAALMVGTAVFPALMGHTAAAAAPSPLIQPKVFAAAPKGVTKPDDITMLNNTLYVTYQNNAGKDGTPAGSFSTIVGLATNGVVVATYTVTGRVDGLTADRRHGRLIATVNEDLNSSLYVIVPGSPPVITQYMYSPSPAETGSDGTNGGTDAISIAPDGTVYIAHSNPDLSLPGVNNTAAVYKLTLGATTATVTPVFGVSDTATVVNPMGGPTSAVMGLSDPDSNRFLPDNGGTLAQVAQADSKIVFATNLGAVTPTLSQLNLTNAVTPTSGVATTPQIDDIERVTGKGTLYAVDQGSGNIYAIDTSQVPTGTVFASQPSPAAGDQPNDPALSTVDLTTGMVTHVDSTLKSPKGLLFVPAPAPGYWEVASDGGIFGFGAHAFFGSMGGTPLNKPVVGIAAAPDGRGYWEVASDGGLFGFGSAKFFGSMGGTPLNKPVVGIAAAPDGQGYWEVASDGGLFGFGSATFYGSMGGTPINQPVVGITAAHDGLGYWEVASDGGLFGFGSATFFGSMGGTPLNKPVVGIAAAPDGLGYWEVASDGGLFGFGSATFYGSMGGTPLNKPVVGMAG